MAIDFTEKDVRIPLLYPPSATWSMAAGGRGTAQFTLKVRGTDTYQPTVGAEIAFFDLGVRCWTGSIDTWKQTILAIQSGLDPVVTEYACTGVTLDSRLDKRLVSPRVYEGMSTGQIVQTLMDEIGPSENVYTSTVEDDGTILEQPYVIDWKPLTAIIQELADLSQFIWRIDAEGFLFFGHRLTLIAPFTLTGAETLAQRVA